MSHRFARSSYLVLAGVIGMLHVAAPARASVITVNSLADAIQNDASCTLREAVINANNDNQSGSVDCEAGSSTDRIVFAVGGEITLVSGQLDLTTNVIIEGPSSAADDGPRSKSDRPEPKALTLSGNHASRIFEIMGGGTVTISRLEIINGSSANGAAVAVREGSSLTLANCVLRRNDSTGNGGAIWSQGRLTVADSTLRENSAILSGGGGAIISGTGSTLFVSRSTFRGNTAGSGGAITSHGFTTVVDSRFIRNTAIFGGGIYHNVGIAVIVDSRFVNNAASSGPDLFNAGGLVELVDDTKP